VSQLYITWMICLSLFHLAVWMVLLIDFFFHLFCKQINVAFLSSERSICGQTWTQWNFFVIEAKKLFKTWLCSGYLLCTIYGFTRNQARSQVGGKMHMGQDLRFIKCLKQIFLSTKKIGGKQSKVGGRCRHIPPWLQASACKQSRHRSSFQILWNLKEQC